MNAGVPQIVYSALVVNVRILILITAFDLHEPVHGRRASWRDQSLRF